MSPVSRFSGSRILALIFSFSKGDSMFIRQYLKYSGILPSYDKKNHI